MSWLGTLRAAKAEVIARQEKRAASADAWISDLVDLRGEQDAGFERVSTNAVFDRLGVPLRQRTSASARRLAAAMRHLGWDTSRWRPAGCSTKVRGFLRAAS